MIVACAYCFCCFVFTAIGWLVVLTLCYFFSNWIWLLIVLAASTVADCGWLASYRIYGVVLCPAPHLAPRFAFAGSIVTSCSPVPIGSAKLQDTGGAYHPVLDLVVAAYWYCF
jgi:hypothetical protein